MPVSALGDRRAVVAPARATTGTVVVTIPEPPQATSCMYSRMTSVLACILLVAAGVSVGVWAATN